MHDAGVSYSLGVSPTSVVVSLGLATYARRYARRRLRSGVTSLGRKRRGNFFVMDFPAVRLTAHALNMILADESCFNFVVCIY